MNDRKVIRELEKLLKVNAEDIPKTLQRFKKEIKDLK